MDVCPIERNKMRVLLQRAKKLLNVHDDQFEHSVRHKLIKDALSSAFAEEGRAVKNLPLAGERSEPECEFITWSGSDTVFGDYINTKDERGVNRFKLLTECLVVKFITDGSDKITGALVRELRSGKEVVIKAKVR